MSDDFYLGHTWNPKSGRIGRRVTVDLRSHLTMLGPTSCGKGVAVEIPNLLRDGGLRRASVVSIDPTAQNASVTGRWRRTFSDLVYLNPFNLLNLGDTGFNPLLTVRGYDDAAALGECLQDMKADAKDPIWQDNSADLLAGLILWERHEARREGRTPTLENVRGYLTGDLQATATKMVATGDFQLASLAGRFTQDNRTIQSIVTTAAASTRWLLSEPMRRSLSVKDGFDWARLKGPKPVTVFVILDADKLKTFAGWLRLVVVSALNTLYRLGGGGLRTVFMLSEFAQLGKLEPVISALGQGRKYGIRLAPMVLQDMGQLNAVYGTHNAATVIGNSGCLFAFAPAPCDNQTAEFLSNSAGAHGVIGLSANDDPHGGGVRINVAERDERLWPPEKIRSIPEFHGLVWKSGKGQPQPVYCPPYWEIPELAGRYDPDPYHPGSGGGRRIMRRVTWAAVALVAAVIAGAVTLHPSALQALLPTAARPFFGTPLAPPVLHPHPQRRQ